MSNPGSSAPVLTDIGWRRFLREYWPYKPLYRRRGARISELADLCTPGGVASLAVRSQMELKAMLPSRAEEHTEITIGAADILPVLESGATIACNSVHRWHPAVRRWTELMARSLTGTTEIGVCNAYVTPAGLGVPMHFDDHEIIVVQLAGKKTWTFAPNTQVVNPTANSGRVLSAEVQPYSVGPILKRMPTPNRSVSMSPGSVLFLPRGYWHETDAKELSISITFGFRTPCWAELITSYLRRRLILNSAWREPAWGAYRDDPDGIVEAKWRAQFTDLEEAVPGMRAEDLAPGNVGKHSLRPHSTGKRNQR
jgi:50S ribosomal protein L16 3-hydroxylase